MPVTFDASAASVQTSTASTSIALTIAANACLLVGVATDGTVDKSISSVIANGTTLTQLGRFKNEGANMIVQIFGLTAAPSGVVSISANVVGAAVLMHVMAVSYLGARVGSNPFGTVNGGTAGAVNNFAISLSTSSTDRVVFFAAGFNNISCINATQRQIASPNFSCFIADTAGSSAAISLSATAVITSQNIAFLGVNVLFSAAATTKLYFNHALLGVGR